MASGRSMLARGRDAIATSLAYLTTLLVLPTLHLEIARWEEQSMIQALIALKDRCIAAIEEAAKIRDASEVLRLSNLLQEIEAALRGATALDARTKTLQEQLLSKPVGRVVGSGHRDVRGTTAKEFGRELRSSFAAELGLALENGTIYRTPSGSRAGIATARERSPNRWFLGLPDDEHLDYIVLLCDTETDVLPFIVPTRPVLWPELWPDLSRSGGQLKLNVGRRNGSYWLKIPGQSPLRLDSYLNTPLV